MILELSQRFHEIHFETVHLSSIQPSLFTSWQNIQLGYRFRTNHGQGGYDSTESYRYRPRFWTLIQMPLWWLHSPSISCLITGFNLWSNMYRVTSVCFFCFVWWVFHASNLNFHDCTLILDVWFWINLLQGLNFHIWWCWVSTRWWLYFRVG